MIELACVGFLFYYECKSKNPTVTPGEYRQLCEVGTVSRQDTPETRRFVVRQNAKCRRARAVK